MPMSTVQWIVGPEHNDATLSKLMLSLLELGYKIQDESWGVGGSQEIHKWAASSLEGSVSVESETYIGLSVIGTVELVEKLKAHYLSRAV
jgi:hypothetical protein